MFCGAGADDRDTQRRLRRQIDRSREFTLRQHCEPELLRRARKIGHVVLDPPNRQVVVRDGHRIAICAGAKRRAQGFVAGHHRGDGGLQSLDIHLATEPVRTAQIHQRGRHPVGEPYTVLPCGQPWRGIGIETCRRPSAGDVHLDATIAHGAQLDLTSRFRS